MKKTLAGTLLLTLFSSSVWPLNTFNVTVANVDDGTNGLRAAINAINAAPSDPMNTITFGGAVTAGTSLVWTTKSANLPPIMIAPGNSLIINSNHVAGLTLDGTGTTFRGLLVYSGDVTINNINMAHLSAQGGAGGLGRGSGGLGAGGALFVNQNASLTMGTAAAFNGNAANGGNGAAALISSPSQLFASGGGGGGMNANGGGGVLGPNPAGGGGGGGLFGAGRAATMGGGGSGGGGLFGTGGNSGGTNSGGGGGGGIFGGNGQNGQGTDVGGNGGSSGGAGGMSSGANGGDAVAGNAAGGGGGGSGGGGNGGNGLPSTGTGGGGGGGMSFDLGGDGGVGGDIGGGGGGGGYSVVSSPGAGSGGAASSNNFGGGGGGCGVITSSNQGGGGGFGGGGGGGGFVNGSDAAMQGGAGGFGAGGGGSSISPGGTGGAFGGNGGGGGGGGAGLGGAIFIRQGGTFTLTDTLQFGNSSANTVAAGSGGGGGASGGQSFGPDIFLMSGGTFVCDNAGSVTLAADIISGGAGGGPGGGLIKMNSGTVILSGSNTYTGGTQIDGGTVSIGSVGNLGSGGVTFESNSTLQFSAAINPFNLPIGINSGILGIIDVGSFNSTISSIIADGTGPGALQKLGAGILTLSGANTYTGPTTVAAGRLTLDGSVESDVTVDSTATLGGTGIIHGSAEILNGGTLNPGNSIGTLTVDGAVTYDSGSTYAIEIDPSASSKVIATGGASIASGAILFVDEDPGDYFSGTSYSILETPSGTISGPLFTIQSMDPAFLPRLSLSLNAAGQILFLTIDANEVFYSIPTGHLTGNRLSLANYLNSLNNQDFLPLFPIFDKFVSLSASQIDQALDLISPARNAFSTFASQNSAFAFNDILESRISNRRFIRASGAGIYSSPQVASLVAMNGTESCGNICPQPRCARFSVWAAPFGEFGREQAQKQTPAFDFNAGGILAGFDAFNLERFLVGFSLGYAHINLDEDNGFGEARLNDYVASLYGSYFGSTFYLDLALWGGYHQTHGKRNIFFNGFSAAATSRTHGWQVVPHAELGLDYFFGCVALEPFARFDCAVNFEDGFAERGASPLNMRQDSRTSSLLRSEVGLSCYQTLFDNESETGYGLFIVRESLSYVNKKPLSGNGRVSAALVGAPAGTFTVETLTQTQNLIAPGIEFFYRWNNGGFLSADYEGEWSGVYWSNTFIVKAGKEF